MDAPAAALIAAPSCDVNHHDPVYYWETVQFEVGLAFDKNAHRATRPPSLCFPQIDGYLFKLPRYHFIVGSDSFAEQYLQVPHQENPAGFVDGESKNEVDGHDAQLSTTSDTPNPGPKLHGNEVVELDGVTASEFRTFLKLLFPM